MNNELNKYFPSEISNIILDFHYKSMFSKAMDELLQIKYKPMFSKVMDQMLKIKADHARFIVDDFFDIEDGDEDHGTFADVILNYCISMDFINKTERLYFWLVYDPWEIKNGRYSRIYKPNYFPQAQREINYRGATYKGWTSKINQYI